MRKREAFTLIELLAVIAIIALLVAIVLPTLQRVKKQAKAVICQSNLKQWSTIFAIYTDSSNGLLPEQLIYRMGLSDPWMYPMRDHCVGTEGIRCCPMATKLANPTGQDGRDERGGTFLAWGKHRFQSEHGVRQNYYGSYGMNSWLATPAEGGSFVLGCPSPALRPNFWKTTKVKYAGHIPVFLDSWWWCAWAKETDEPPQYEGQNTPFPCGCRDSIRRFCINRHDGFVNGLFLDWSVRKVGLKELWTLKWHRQCNTRNSWTRAGGVQPEDWPNWMRHFKDY